MLITPDLVLNTVCKTLNLDRTVLTAKSRNNIKQEYRDGKLLCVYILRQKVNEPKIIQGTGEDKTKSGKPKRMKMEVDKPITYKAIADIFNRCDHTAPLRAELKCMDLLETDSKFKQKYEMIVNVLDNNTNLT